MMSIDDERAAREVHGLWWRLFGRLSATETVSPLSARPAGAALSARPGSAGGAHQGAGTAQLAAARRAAQLCSEASTSSGWRDLETGAALAGRAR